QSSASIVISLFDLKIHLGVLWGLTLFRASSYTPWRKMLKAGGFWIFGEPRHQDDGAKRF
ncbi:MAG: hypothetical protein WC476_13200, partial [Phycisphaerae bacterium]